MDRATSYHSRHRKDIQKDIQTAVASRSDWSTLKNKRILITGASGMIGTFLVSTLGFLNDAFDLDLSLIVTSRNVSKLESKLRGETARSDWISFAQIDVLEPFPPHIPAVDFIINLASNTHPISYASDPIGTILISVMGTKNVLDYAVKCNAQRVCLVSSVEVYGDALTQAPFSETDFGYIDCNTLRAGYPEGKRASEALCQAYREAHGVDCVIVRLPRVIGPTVLENDSKASSQFIENAVAGKDIVLKSEGQQFFSYLYVADAVIGLLFCLLDGRDGEAYNVSHDSWNIQLRELALRIAKLAGTEVVFDMPNQIEARGFSAAHVALLNGTKIAALGWHPNFDIDAGLAHTIDILKSLQQEHDDGSAVFTERDFSADNSP